MNLTARVAVALAVAVLATGGCSKQASAPTVNPKQTTTVAPAPRVDLAAASSQFATSWQWNQALFNRAVPLFTRARQADLQGKLTEAVALYRQGLAVFPAAVDQLGYLGLDLLKLDDDKGARNAWSQAIQIGQKRLQANGGPSALQPGDSLFDDGHIQAAFKSYDAAWSKLRAEGAEVNPRFQDTGAAQDFFEALKLAGAGHLDEATHRLQSATTLSPDFEEAHYFLGNALFAQGDIAQAKQQWMGVVGQPGFRNQIVHGPDEYQIAAITRLLATMKPNQT